MNWGEKILKNVKISCSSTKAQAHNTINQTQYRQAVFLSHLSKRLLLTLMNNQGWMGSLLLACLCSLNITCIDTVISWSAASASSCLVLSNTLCSPAFLFSSSTRALASFSLDTPAYINKILIGNIFKRYFIHTEPIKSSKNANVCI